MRICFVRCIINSGKRYATNVKGINAGKLLCDHCVERRNRRPRCRKDNTSDGK